MEVVYSPRLSHGIAVRSRVGRGHGWFSIAPHGGRYANLGQAPDARWASSVARSNVACSEPNGASHVHEVELARAPPGNPVLFYVPGADGTGAAMAPHLRSLKNHGLSVRCVVIPSSNRHGWRQLTDAVVPMLSRARSYADAQPVIVLAESFGACLALRLALACPETISSLVIVNSATAFNSSLGGLPSLISQTGLLALFPERLYKVSQGIMLPLLLNPDRAEAKAGDIFQSMMSMAPSSTPALLSSLDDPPSSSVGRRWLPTSAAQAEHSDLSQPDPPPFTHAPAEAANFRLQLLRGGDLTTAQLSKITVPTVLVSSAQDRLFPSMKEGARLQRAIPGARRVVLPESGHAPLLEQNFVLRDFLIRTRVLHAEPFTEARVSAPAQDRVPPPDRPSNGGSGRTINGVESHAAPQMLTATGSDGHVQSADSSGAGQVSDFGSRTHAERVSVQTHEQNGEHRGHLAVDAGPTAPAHSTAAAAASAAASRLLLNDGVVDDRFDEGCESFRAWRDLISPVLLATERLPPLRTTTAGHPRPLLFVGNHTQFGMYDMPLLFMELYTRGYLLTGLAHPDHWKTPMGAFFEAFGAVRATPLSAYRALRSGKNVLLFPGGGREVSKNRDERYRLFWPATADFARLAASTNAMIVPFAAVGGDDAFDLAMDTSDILSHPIFAPMATAVVDSVIGEGRDAAEVVMPITRFPGSPVPSPVPLSNLGRVYFKFGEVVDMEGVDSGDRAACRAAGVLAQTRVEQGLVELLAVREEDPERGVWGRARRNAVKAINLATRL